jgi:hypothetical protein
MLHPMLSRTAALPAIAARRMVGRGQPPPRDRDREGRTALIGQAAFEARRHCL